MVKSFIYILSILLLISCNHKEKENGNYNIVSRWVPLRCGNSITKQLAQIAVELRNRALFKNFIQAKTGMTKKEIEAWYPD